MSTTPGNCGSIQLVNLQKMFIIVQRNLHLLGYKRQFVRKRVNISAVNKCKHIYWCRTKLTWTVESNWKNVIFIVQMMINLKPDGQFTVWRKANEKWRLKYLGYLACNVKTNLNVIVWGCICYSGIRILAFIDGNMNTQKYIQILDQHLWTSVAKHFVDNSWVFQEDNAPAQKSHEASVWKERNNIPVFFWPTQSPDLNPIENI